jgi:organic hydroperoxide reductase OsmC/OhrA
MHMAEILEIELVQLSGYRFEVHFTNTDLPVLMTDEQAPLGSSSGPNPARLLGTAVANCLAASLLFSLRKFGNEPGPLQVHATVSLERNPQGRMRVSRIGVEIRLGVAAATLQHADRALAQFEDFCIVTQSVRAGIDVAVKVTDSAGVVLKG